MYQHAFPMPSDRHLANGGIADEGDDTVYDDYIATTNYPGNTLLIIAIIFCACSLLGLPLFVKLGRHCKHKGDSSRVTDDSQQDSQEHYLGPTPV